MMFIRYIILLLFTFVYLNTAGQVPGQMKCFGTVIDSLTRKPIEGAVVTEIAGQGDDIAVKNYVTDKKGRFSFDASWSLMSNRIEISCLGYKVYSRMFLLNTTDGGHDFGTIRLAPDTYNIDEVVVRARMEMFRVSGDTTLYFPRSVNTMEGDAVIEILRRMPGVEVTENGNVIIQGKPVERTYLNGKLIFGEDPTKPLRLIDAKEAQLIQAYDEPDEKDMVLNGEDARKRKVLNIITFRDFDDIIAGNIKADAGADREKNIQGGRKGRYNAEGEIGKYNEDLQIDLIGYITNLNNSGINSSGERRHGMGWLSVGGKTKTDSYYTVGYRYTGERITNDLEAVTDYFTTSDFTSQQEESWERSVRRINAHSINIHYPWWGDKLTVDPQVDISFGNTSSSAFAARSVMRDGVRLSDIRTSTEGDGKDYSIQPKLSISKGLGKHSLSFDIDATVSRNTGTSLRKDTIDQAGLQERYILSIDTKNPNVTVTPGLKYRVELKKGSLNFASSVSYIDVTRRELALNMESGDIDPARSGDIVTRNTTIDEKISYYLKENKKYTINIGVAYLGTSIDVKEKMPHNIRTEKYYHALLPSISYSWEKNPKVKWNVSLGSGQTIPLARFISTWIDDTNPIFVHAGNPKIEPSRDYSLSSGFKISSDNSSAFSFDIKGTGYYNSIIEDRTYYKDPLTLAEYNGYIIPAGATLTRPVNGKQSYGVGISAGYDTPLKLIRSILKVSAKYEYANPEYSINGKLVHTQQHSANGKIELMTNFSSLFRINIKDEFRFSALENNEGYTNKSFRNTGQVTARWDFTTMTELNVYYKMDYYSNDAMEKDIVNHTLNASVGFRVFKNKKGKLSLNAHDILNRTKSLTTNITDQYVRTTYSKIFSSFYSVSFEYRF